MPVLTTMKMRRGTAAQWALVDPVLAAGEPGYESDTGVLKVGDGVTAWSALDPIASGMPVFDVSAAPYHAVGDGVTDDSAAVQAAINAAFAARVTRDVSNPTGGAPAVYFPPGTYRLATTLAAPGYLNIVGDFATLLPDAGVAAFTFASLYRASVQGLHFNGGTVAFDIDTNNVDKCYFLATRCFFKGQSVATARTSADSNSTVLSFRDCWALLTDPAAKLLHAQSGDHITWSGGWITSGCDTTFDIDDATFALFDVIMVPTTTTGAWVNMSGNSRVTCDLVRFGGEGGGRTLVESSSAANVGSSGNLRGIHIDRCESFTGTKPMIKLLDIPNYVTIGRLIGHTNGMVLYALDPAIPAASYALIGTSAVRFDHSGMGGADRLRMFDQSVTLDSAAHRIVIDRDDKITRAALGTGQRVLNLPHAAAGLGRLVIPNNTSSAAATGLWGDSELTVTALADDATYTHYWDTAMNGLPDGPYTFVCEIEVLVGAPATVTTFAGGSRRRAWPRGRHEVSIPFYFEAGVSSERIGYEMVEMRTGDEVKIQTARVYSGHVEQAEGRTIAYGDAAPTAGAWLLYDFVWNTQPAAGEPLGWVCTAAGTPGTWKPVGIVDMLAVANTWAAEQTFSGGTNPLVRVLRGGEAHARIGNTLATIAGGAVLGKLLFYSGDATAPGAGDVASIRGVQKASSPNGQVQIFTNRDDVLAVTFDTDGRSIFAAPAQLPSYTTAGRPSAVTSGAGALAFDTTLGKMIVSNGATWEVVTSA